MHVNHSLFISISFEEPYYPILFERVSAEKYRTGVCCMLTTPHHIMITIVVVLVVDSLLVVVVDSLLLVVVDYVCQHSQIMLQRQHLCLLPCLIERVLFLYLRCAMPVLFFKYFFVGSS